MSATLSRNQISEASATLAASAPVVSEGVVLSGSDDMVRDRVKNLAKMLGIKVPIFQAPFGNGTTPALVAAVANAGGLGGLSVTFGSVEQAGSAIKSTLTMTSASFVVNFVLTHFEPLNVPIALEAGAKLVSFTIGRPDAALVRRVTDAGARFMCQVGTLDAAKQAFDLGAIAVIAQGMEAGGHHEGSTPRRKLLELIVQKFPTALVVSAGGVSSPEDILGDLRMGASGVTLGTPFLATPQSNAHPAWQEAIVRADENSTAVTMCFSDGWPQIQRVLRNGTLTAWESAGMPVGDKRPGHGDVVATNAQGGQIKRYSMVSPANTVFGQIEEMALYAGTSAASVKAIMDAKDVLKAYWNPVGKTLGIDLA